MNGPSHGVATKAPPHSARMDYGGTCTGAPSGAATDFAERSNAHRFETVMWRVMTDVQQLVPIAAAFALVGTVMLTSAAPRSHRTCARTTAVRCAPGRDFRSQPRRAGARSRTGFVRTPSPRRSCRADSSCRVRCGPRRVAIRAGRQPSAADTREHRRGDGALSGWRAVLPGVHAPPGAAERGKERIWALCRWHLQPGGGSEYCRACREGGLPCARGERGAAGRLCPYREHALISQQEHEAWDVLLACQGQLRLTRSGHVSGLDMNAVFKVGAARGYDLAALSELLPAAEAGLVEALRRDQV